MPETSVNPLGALRQEHQVVRDQLLRLEEVLPRLVEVPGEAAENLGVSGSAELAEASVERSREVLVEIGSFLSQEMESHLLKEEVALFSPLEKALGGSIGSIAAMRAEHDQMRENNQALQRRLRRLQTGHDDVDTRRELGRCGAAASDLIRRHLEQEDVVVFRLAEEALSRRRLRAALRKMALMAR